MVNSKEKLYTRKGVYFVEESRDHYDFISFGSLKLKTGGRQSVGFSDHSNRFKVVHAPEDGKYAVGDYVWGHHMIYKSPVSFIHNTYATLESNLWFKGQTPDSPQSSLDGLVIFKAYVEEEKASNGIVYQLKKEDVSRGVVLHGDLPKGSVITYWKNKEYEMFYGEERFFIVETDNITTLNGQPYGDFYFCDFFENEERLINGITFFGQAAAIRRYGFDSIQGHIAKLYNPKLPLHGKVAILNKKWEYSKVADGESRGIVAVLT